MSELSPAAQAVIGAMSDVYAMNCPTAPLLAASVIRAVVKSCVYVDSYGIPYTDNDKILAIAAELEACLE